MQTVQIRKSSRVGFLKVNKPQRIICGVIYTADEIDGQGDEMAPQEVFTAMLSHSRHKIMKIMHDKPAPEIKILESYMIGSDGADIDGTRVPPNSWVMSARVSPEIFEKVLDGSLTGFSMSGSAKAQVISEGRKSYGN